MPWLVDGAKELMKEAQKEAQINEIGPRAGRTVHVCACGGKRLRISPDSFDTVLASAHLDTRLNITATSRPERPARPT